jgi:hypothetical protein
MPKGNIGAISEEAITNIVGIVRAATALAAQLDVSVAQATEKVLRASQDPKLHAELQKLIKG